MTPRTIAYQVPPSMGFSRQEYWSRVPFPFPGDLPSPGIEPAFPMSPALQADSLPLSHWGSPSGRLLLAKCSGSQGLSGCQGWPPWSSPSISPSTQCTLQCHHLQKFLSTDHRGLEICFSAYPLKTSLGSPASLTTPVRNMHSAVGIRGVQTLSVDLLAVPA